MDKKCGDCIHADVCEHNPNIPLFNRANAAYCKGFKDRTNYAEVVRCQNCVHAEPLDHNCELSTSLYMHCKLWRGEETKNVWHKYKKYYKDYSLVERDGYCDAGAKMDVETE
jgi:hypothetical protein